MTTAFLACVFSALASAQTANIATDADHDSQWFARYLVNQTVATLPHQDDEGTSQDDEGSPSDRRGGAQPPSTTEGDVGADPNADEATPESESAANNPDSTDAAATGCQPASCQTTCCQQRCRVKRSCRGRIFGRRGCR